MTQKDIIKYKLILIDLSRSLTKISLGFVSNLAFICRRFLPLS